jgi:hypothetical protein
MEMYEVLDQMNPDTESMRGLKLGTRQVYQFSSD